MFPLHENNAKHSLFLPNLQGIKFPVTAEQFTHIRTESVIAPTCMAIGKQSTVRFSLKTASNSQCTHASLQLLLLF